MPTFYIQKSTAPLMKNATPPPNVATVGVDTSGSTPKAFFNADGTPHSLVSEDQTQTLTNKIIADSGGLARFVPNGTSKALTSGSAISLVDVAMPSGTGVGGALIYNVEVTDGTDYQSLSGLVTYGAVNKVGTNTLTITELTTTQAKAVSSGTLTNAWTFVTGTNKGTIKLASTTSLTATTFTVTYTLLPIIGVPTIL